MDLKEKPPAADNEMAVEEKAETDKEQNIPAKRNDAEE